MRGSLVHPKGLLSLDQLHSSPWVEKSPYGHQLQLPQGAALNLFVDQLLIRFEWSEREPDSRFWTPSIPLPTARHSLAA